ncbi:MAG: NUDIX domain-containing protein [Oscillospiraceae bacterium]|nr:NUDIX domain-containing protein [Oscillospiraceae bacterium]
MSEITLMSFGYVFGPPEGADTVIGTRGLPNPYWAEELKHKTGLDQEVRDYVFSTPEVEAYFESCLDMLRRRIAFYERYDSPLKTPLLIAVGCTGGKHRSVSMTLRLAAALAGEGIPVRVLHRDLDKVLEHSAGAVVFTRQAGEPRFVILRSVFGNPGFPKGHIEAGENDRDTALREAEEEIGLRIRLLPGFRTVNVFPLPNRPKTWKQVVYYLGEYENQPLRPREGEIAEARLLPYEAALSALSFENTRGVLREAKAFLDGLPAPRRSGGH